MIHPSYSELIQAINNNVEEDDNTMMLNSRYSLVLATSKRARQLIAGAEPLVPNTASGEEEDAVKTQPVAEEAVENIEETTENNQ